MVRVKRSTLGNAYLRPFSNYDEVQLVSIAILVRPELRVTLGTDCDIVGDHSISGADSGGFHNADCAVLSNNVRPQLTSLVDGRCEIRSRMARIRCHHCSCFTRDQLTFHLKSCSHFTPFTTMQTVLSLSLYLFACNVAYATGAPLSLWRPHHFTISTQGEGN